MLDTLAHWITVVSHNDESSSTHHFDALNLGWDPALRGLSLLDFCLSTLEQTRQHIQMTTCAAPLLRPVVYLLLGTSEAIMPWTVSMWSALGDDPEPPSLYLILNTTLFNEHDEAYQRTLDLPGAGSHQFHAIYRCFRSEEYRHRMWEFNRGIYIV